ncbi:hypothetical protein [Loigolactobacillus binensis]|uniref:Uncharacterized protein n=1 Tax=Loigolactobacillus binensis TaxID=2559922 RepID=A0ABW3EH60_9LACO|nr:hypothetical protein [Loigolactobacillus binensis]
MKDLISDRKLINTIMWVLLSGLAFFGTVPLFIVTYWACALFMILRTRQSQLPRKISWAVISAYIVLGTLQTIYVGNAVAGPHLNLLT